jgi:hypothetical protein
VDEGEVELVTPLERSGMFGLSPEVALRSSNSVWWDTQ